jgi:signal transduction histidine kinase
VQRVDVFVEADSGELTGYVRDTGKGFDPAGVPGDRRGISDSIVGRVQRAGGTTLLHSQPGSGTEVEVKVPRR